MNVSLLFGSEIEVGNQFLFHSITDGIDFLTGRLWIARPVIKPTTPGRVRCQNANRDAGDENQRDHQPWFETFHVSWKRTTILRRPAARRQSRSVRFRYSKSRWQRRAQ